MALFIQKNILENYRVIGKAEIEKQKELKEKTLNIENGERMFLAEIFTLVKIVVEEMVMENI